MAIIGEPNEDYTSLLSSSDDSKKVNEVKDEVTNELIKEDSKKVENVSNNDNSVPDGVTVVTMPRLSDTMEEGTVASTLSPIA